MTSEPSFENWSPLAISESDSTCRAGEPAIESDAPLPALAPPDSFIHRASSAGVAASQSLAVLSQLAVTIVVATGGSDFGRGRIPDCGGSIPACCHDPRTVGTKPCVADPILMGKGGEERARGRIPEFGGVVGAGGQDPRTVRTKHRVV